MFFSKKLVEQYQAIHERKFGKRISSKEAERELFNLTNLIRTIAKGSPRK